MSRSGYYGWRKPLATGPVGRAAQDAELLAEIRTIHAQFGYYGSPRVHCELLARRQHAGRHRVARLMRVHGIRARRGKRKARPRSAPPTRRPEVTDRVRRQFAAPVPDALWFTDVTELVTGEGRLFAAVVLDAFNREVVSWATDGYQTPRTALGALQEAIRARRPPPGCVVHSDRGYQFTSREWLDLAASNELEPSIGERNNALDNAVVESWFSSFKSEAIHPYPLPKTRAEARTTLFRYVWAYNTQRRHSALGYLSPKDYAEHASTCP